MSSRGALMWLVAVAALVAGGKLAGDAGGCVPLLDCGPSGPAEVTVVDSLRTVRLDQPTSTRGASSGASLVAARNEFESFQIVVDAGGSANDVEVASGKPLRGPGGAVIPARNLSIYREVPYEVGTDGKPVSDSEGSPGLWPDALIPARDYFYGERRNAFPVDIPAGAKMVAWIDVLIPAGARSGTYRGSVLVRDSSGLIRDVPLRVRVLGFSIPSTSSLDSAFGLDWTQVCEAFTGDGGCRGDQQRRWRLHSLFMQAGLENRISLYNPAPTDSTSPPHSASERKSFVRNVLPLVNGTAPVLRLRGAQLNTLGISWYCLDVDSRCLERWHRLASGYGFAARTFFYICDEPGEDAEIWRACRQRTAISTRQWRSVHQLVTANVQNARRFGGRLGDGETSLDQIDILAALVNDVAGLQGTDLAGDQRPEYSRYLSQPADGVRKRLWLYTSCASYGCKGEPVDSPFTIGWPGYAIDEPASEARAMGWLAYEYRAGGELYYQTTARLSQAWRNSYLEGGNGDGTLFYPGAPNGAGGGPAIGGRHAIPIESIRLKRIRDGREDYEYLRILSRRGHAGAAMSVVRGVFGSPEVAMHSSAVDPAALNAARRKLAAMIAD